MSPYLFLLLPTLLSATYKLEYVSEISRHGARTPVYDAIDPFNTDWGVLEAGDLTPVGMRQHYLLGVQFNRRYNSETGTVGHLYNDTYNGYDFYVQSSNYPRTLLSAYSQLEGLFPMNKRPNLTKAQSINAVPPSEFSISEFIDLGLKVLPQNYQIIPVIAHQKNKDPFLYEWCPAYRKMKDSTNQTQEYKELNERYQSVREDVYNVVGTSIENVDVQYLGHLQDALTARLAFGKEIGPLSRYYNGILSSNYENYVLKMTRNPTLLKIINTKYLKEVYSKFTATVQEAMNGNRDSPERLKFSFYSYHDDQQLQLCVGLGIDMSFQAPPYASTLVMQLWHDESKSALECRSVEECKKQYYVKTKYNDSNALVPSKCQNKITQNKEEACRLDEWWQFVEQQVIYTGSDINQICGIQ